VENSPEQLFTKHTPLALSLVNKYRSRRTFHLIEDMRSEAMIGLWKACIRYNPELHYSFSTIAYILIRGSIIDFLRRERVAIRGNGKRVELIYHDDQLDMREHDGQGFTGIIEHINMSVDLDWAFTRGDLSDIQVLTLREYYCSHKNLSEISKDHHRPYGQVLSAFHSGMESLKCAISV
jgi:RNA polymerase sigma factor (sigma-70 family)